jgi:hypothetical protein
MFNNFLAFSTKQEQKIPNVEALSVCDLVLVPEPFDFFKFVNGSLLLRIIRKVWFSALTNHNKIHST